MSIKAKFFLVLILLIAIPVEVYVLNTIFPSERENTVYKRTTVQTRRVIGKLEHAESKTNSLRDVVDKALVGTTGKYGIVVKHLKTGEAYTLHEHEVFQPGSLYKIWVLATAFRHIKNGLLREEEVLSQDIDVLNKKFHIDEDVAELTDGVIELTVSQALTQMITISHNYAALLLSERLGNSQIREFLSSQGLIESHISSSDEAPTTTPYDIALFFEKLYKEELVDQQSSQKMIALLKLQTLNDGIPKYLPKDIAIAHKTGEIEWFKHDAGIVFSDGGDYIIVVLSESNTPLGAQERIAQVSEAVYKYFNKH